MKRIAIPALAVAASLVTAGSALAAPPPNDDFEHATPIGDAPATVTGTLDGATRQPGDPTAFPPNVWYAFRPTVDGPIAIDPMTPGVSVEVFTGPDHDHLTPAARPAADWSMTPRVDAKAGTTYWLAAEGEPMSPSSFSLRLRPATAPSNDGFSDARRVRVPGIYRGNLADATTELGESGDEGRSVWYRFKPAATSRITVDATGSSCTPDIVAATGSDVASLRHVAHDSGVLRFHASRGRVYDLRVACSHPGVGDYVLDVSDGSIKGKGIDVQVAPDQTVSSVRRHGLHLSVGTRREANVSIAVLVSKRTQHRLGLSSPVLGRARGHLDPGQRLPAGIALSSAAARALAGRDALEGTVRLTLLSHAPNRVLSVPFSVFD